MSIPAALKLNQIGCPKMFVENPHFANLAHETNDAFQLWWLIYGIDTFGRGSSKVDLRSPFFPAFQIRTEANRRALIGPAHGCHLRAMTIVAASSRPAFPCHKIQEQRQYVSNSAFFFVLEDDHEAARVKIIARRKI